MLLPDDLIIKRNCSKDMIKMFKRKKCSVMASMKVNKKTVNRWGIYSIKSKINNNNFYIKDVIEKPEIKSAPSNRAVIGRYILPRKIFAKLKNQKKGKGGEIHITDSIRKLIYEGDKFIGHSFFGKYLDCGTMQGYIKSSLEIFKNMKLCMIGTGYVGLVSGTCFSDLGNKVICADIDENKINKLKSCKIPIYEPGLGELVKKNFYQKRLSFTTDIGSAIKDSDIIFICVGTPTKKKSNTADLKYVFQAANLIAKNINKYKIIVTKSTVPITTGDKIEKIIKSKSKKKKF